MNNHHLIQDTLNHLFRQESGKMIAVLIKIFGTAHITLAEDVLQDTLISALETWKFKGIPDNPKAWLYRVARNKAIDIIRKNKHTQHIDFSDTNSNRVLLTSEYTLTTTMDTYWEDQHINDDFLAMMFACCHPKINQKHQITFILKTLCGFSTKEIARAFLTSQDTISKRIYRTKEFFRTQKIKPKIPEKHQLQSHLDTILYTIYLLFNEGYNATHTDELIRKDVVDQALYLCHCLVQHKQTQLPQVYALMALMCFHTARLESRISIHGNLILLKDQQREKWDQELIATANYYLNKAAFGNHLSSYHLEAAIAYQHCIAKSYQETNWTMILTYYDLLYQQQQDPIIFLNRCLVILELQGPVIALKTVQKLSSSKQIKAYYLYYAILGEIYHRLQQQAKALAAYQKALSLTQSKIEKAFLKEKIEKLLL